jgi:hypothetical protein
LRVETPRRPECAAFRASRAYRVKSTITSCTA